MKRRAKRFYEFDSFRVDTDERQLLRNGRSIPLTPKVFELLLLLIENNGHTLAKEELMQRLWTGAYVEENSLSRNISTLRKVLGTDAQNSGLIKTVPKYGYRFEANVREVLVDEEELVVETRTNYSVILREEIGKDTIRTLASEFVSGHRLSLAAVTSTLLIAALMWTMYFTDIGESLFGVDAGGGKQVGGTLNAEASDLFQRGRSLWQNRSAAGLHEATLLLEQAVEKDPDFALAHAALADAYAFDTRNWKKVEETANRAIALEPTLGEPYASIGFIKFFWEWQPTAAKSHFRKAVTLSPHYATGHQWFAITLAATGQFNEGLAEMERALELDPASVPINADLCQVLYFLRRYDEAETQCRKTLAMDKNSFSARSNLYQVYTAKEMYDEAVEEFIKREMLSVNNASIPDDFGLLRTAYLNGGIRAFWREQIRQRRRPTTNLGYTIGWYHALLGEKDEALRNLQHAYDVHEFDFVLFFADPVFREFSNDNRFQELAERLIEAEK